MRHHGIGPSMASALLASGTLVLAGAALPETLTSPQAGAAAGAKVLVASPGPRQTPWKRSFNPFRSETGFLWPASAGVYEPLVVYNRATGSYLPWLATGYDWSEDNLTLRFALRPGVVWSLGKPFSARDVTFTFDLIHRVP